MKYMSNDLKTLDFRSLVVASDPERILVILDHVANGGSMIDLCKEWKVRYSRVYREIRKNKQWSKLYDQALAARDEFDREDILRELNALRSYDIRDMYHKIEAQDGTVTYKAKHPAEMPANLTSAIKEIDSDGGVKFIDKTKIIDMAGKRLGVLTEKIEIKGKFTLEALVSSSMGDNTNEPEDPSV